MSATELLEIENNLLNTLNLEDLEILVSDLYQKIKERKTKQKNTLPPHIRKGIAQSLKEHKQALGVILETDEEVKNHFLNLKKQNV